MKRTARLAALVFLASLAGVQADAFPARGSAPELDMLSVSGAWVAESLPGQSMTAAYMVIANEGDVDEELLSVESDAAENLELHTMEQQGEMMRMRRVDSIEVGPGEEVTLEPGGLHIMLIGLTRELKAGDTVELTLNFESGTNLTVGAPVKKR